MAFGKFCCMCLPCPRGRSCAGRSEVLPTAPLHLPVKPRDRKWSMGDGVVSEVKVGSGFLNPAMPNAAAGSQGEWLSVAPNLRITCLSLFITQRVPTRKSETWVQIPPLPLASGVATGRVPSISFWQQCLLQKAVVKIETK